MCKNQYHLNNPGRLLAAFAWEFLATANMLLCFVRMQNVLVGNQKFQL